uniref:BEN domain-containing protein n=1 Tax=Macrostomum lignano TaxID=282301 RepID=A0A1I8FPD0_9PLAT
APKRNWLLKCPKSRTNAPLSPPRPASPAQARASPLPATGGAGLPPLLSRFQLANQPSEDAIRSKRLVPYEVDSATVAWLLAHNQQLSPPVDQHGVGGKPTALVRPCRHTRSLGVQTDALSLDTSYLAGLLGCLIAAVAAPQLGPASVSESAGAQSTADAEESAESLRNRCDELAKVNADLKRLLVPLWASTCRAQLDRLSSETGHNAVRPASRGPSLAALRAGPKSAIASASKRHLAQQIHGPSHDRRLAGAGAPAAGQLCWASRAPRPAALQERAASCASDLAD